jgi:hypothetical protein
MMGYQGMGKQIVVVAIVLHGLMLFMMPGMTPMV